VRKFFNQDHPWLMQAIGGLIAVIIMIPIGIYVIASVLNGPSPEAVPSYAPPAAQGQNFQAQHAPPALSTRAPGQASQTQNVGAGNDTRYTGKSWTVKMQPNSSGGYVFSPANLTIHQGDVVNWVDVNQVPHNIVGTGDAASTINRSAINASSYQVGFTKTGTYHYECQVHLPEMVGVITVLPVAKATGANGNQGLGQGAAATAIAAGSKAGNGGTTGGTTGGVVTVKMQPNSSGGYVFNPATVNIKAGQTIQWVDVNQVPHNIVGLNNAASLINRSAINASSYKVTFSAKGAYHYECQVHLPEMVGVVNVS